MRYAYHCALLAGVLLVGLAPAARALEVPPSYWFSLYAGRVSQMCQAPDGRILAPSMEGSNVRVYDENGNLLSTFGSSGTGLGKFNQPTGVAMDQAGNIYVCDQYNHRVEKFSPTYVPLLSMGTEGVGPGQLMYPTNCAVSKDNTKLYVTELTNGRVSVFDLDGNFIKSFGAPGAAPGQFDYPYGIVVEPLTGDLFIANENNCRIDRWTADGTYLSSFGQPGSGIDDFNFVVGLGIDADGNLWATDQLNNRVKKISQAGTTLAVFGTYGGGPNQFYNPWSVFPTRAGAIWVGDTYNYRIETFRYLPVPTVARSWGALKSTFH